MSDAAINPPTQHWWSKVLSRVVVILILAIAVGVTLDRTSKTMERNPRPAGFSRGVLQGALMPMALPNLLFGRDVTIYSQNNTGLTYKIGYTAGVNACGALFFGLFFWRVSRWRRSKA